MIETTELYLNPLLRMSESGGVIYIHTKKFAWLPVMLITGKKRWLTHVFLVHKKTNTEPLITHEFYYDDPPTDFNQDRGQAKELKQIRKEKQHG